MKNKDIKERVKYTKEYKNSIVIGSELREIIEGVILGDATVLRRYPVSDAVIKFCQCARNKDYLFHLYDKFEPLVATPPRRVVLKREKDYVQYMFQTLSFKFISEYRDRYYDKNGKKTIPSDIEDKLTARSLAYWYQDDGTKSKPGYILCTNNFKNEEVEFLREVLKRKFNISTKTRVMRTGRGCYYLIYVMAISAKDFRELISPYVVDSMRRKLWGGVGLLLHNFKRSVIRSRL